MKNELFTVIFGLGFSILASTLAIGGPGSNLQVYAQGGNDTVNITNATAPVPENS